MKVIEAGDPGYVYNGKFTGPVRLEMLIEAAGVGDPDLARVHFDDGAVTNWHEHPGGQVLLLISGVGRVGTDAQQWRQLQPGALVETPVDERHWHGAEQGTQAVWFAMTWGVTGWEDAAPTFDS